MSHCAQELGHPRADDVEPSALPPHALRAGRRTALGDGRPQLHVRGEHGPDAGQPQIRRPLEVFRTRERIPAVGLEQPAAERHAVPHEMAGQAERRTAGETDPVEQQHRGRPQLRSRSVAVGQREVLALHCVCAVSQLRRASTHEVRLGHRVGIHHHHGVDVGTGREQLVDRPSQRPALPSGGGLVPMQHGGAARGSNRSGVVTAVVGDHDDLVQLARVVLLPQRRHASFDVRLLVVRRHEYDGAKPGDAMRA